MVLTEREKVTPKCRGEGVEVITGSKQGCPRELQEGSGIRGVIENGDRASQQGEVLYVSHAMREGRQRN